MIEENNLQRMIMNNTLPSYCQMTTYTTTHDVFLRCPLVLNAESHIQKSQEDIAMLRNRLRSLQDLWRNEQKSWTPKIRGFEESGCDTQV